VYVLDLFLRNLEIFVKKILQIGRNLKGGWGEEGICGGLRGAFAGCEEKRRKSIFGCGLCDEKIRELVCNTRFRSGGTWLAW
jgi:hypothetical protein